MSYCVLATDQVCLVKTETVSYDFASLAVDKKLRNKFFYNNSIKIQILFISGIKTQFYSFNRLYPKLSVLSLLSIQHLKTLATSF